MFKICRNLLILTLLIMLFYVGSIVADKQYLHNETICICIIDLKEEADQYTIVLVNEIIEDYLSKMFASKTSYMSIQNTIEHSISEMEMMVKTLLVSVGFDDRVTISLSNKCFSMRKYESYALPSGVYQCLYVNIGDRKMVGENLNTAFPAICLFNERKTLQTIAVRAYLEFGQMETISNKYECEIRFKILDCIGKIENFFANLLE